MRFHLFKPSPKTIERAHRLADMAHRSWLNIFFFVMCLVESFVMIIPADTLISVTVNIVPEKRKKWLTYSLAGYLLGFSLIIVLIDTSFQASLLHVIHDYGYYGHIEALSERFSQYGYLGLFLSVLGGFPPLACLVAVSIIKLNPVMALIVTIVAKTARIIVMIFIVSKMWAAVIRMRNKIGEKG